MLTGPAAWRQVIDNDGDSFPTFSAEQMDAWGAQGWELQHVNPLQELSSVLTGAAVSANTASASTNGGAEYAGQTLTRPKRVVAWFRNDLRVNDNPLLVSDDVSRARAPLASCVRAKQHITISEGRVILNHPGGSF